MSQAEELIRILELKPHPEGGFYKETYRCEEFIAQTALNARYSGPRSASTAIYFLHTADTFSVMHQVESDELFHFYLGDPVEMLVLEPLGAQIFTIGSDVASGQQPQLRIPRGAYQGCRVKSGGRFALLGCTVAPGFDFADYHESKCADLQKQYPQFHEMIAQLTRN